MWKTLGSGAACLLLSGCFLSGAEVGMIAGELVSHGMAQAKEETRQEIAAAVSSATDVISKRTNELTNTKLGWMETVAAIVATLLAAKGAEKAIKSRSAKE